MNPAPRQAFTAALASTAARALLTLLVLAVVAGLTAMHSLSHAHLSGLPGGGHAVGSHAVDSHIADGHAAVPGPMETRDRVTPGTQAGSAGRPADLIPLWPVPEASMAPAMDAAPDTSCPDCVSHATCMALPRSAGQDEAAAQAATATSTVITVPRPGFAPSDGQWATRGSPTEGPALSKLCISRT